MAGLVLDSRRLRDRIRLHARDAGTAGENALDAAFSEVVEATDVEDGGAFIASWQHLDRVQQLATLVRGDLLVAAGERIGDLVADVVIEEMEGEPLERGLEGLWVRKLDLPCRALVQRQPLTSPRRGPDDAEKLRG